MILLGLYFGITLHYLLVLVVIWRVLTREGREPAARIAWMLVVAALPLIGVLLYLLVGELNLASRPRRRMQALMAGLPSHPSSAPPEPAAAGGEFGNLFDRAAAVNGFSALGGNAAELLPEGAGTIDRLVADIDAARDHVHLLFYIWLADESGRRVIAALERAAGRGVTCRCLVDGMGSRALLRSPDWAALAAAGVQTGVAFRIRMTFLRMFLTRIDIRNHRKIAVIDGGLAYAGSLNCADPAFLPKRRYGPWVDVMVRIEGPLAWQMQQLFVTDWITHTGRDDAARLLDAPSPAPAGAAPAIVCGTGPNIDTSAVCDLFQLACATARERLTLTTPYFVPSEALSQAIRSAALRGVRVRLILPARNDSRFVALASRSYYQPLLRAGVEIHEYLGGLLHAKVVTVDGAAVIFGSANMDRRSFEVNYENNVVAADAALARDFEVRQQDWLGRSRPVALETVAAWSAPRRMVQNLAATFGPLL